MRKIAFIPLAWLVGSLLGLLSLAPTLLLVQLWLDAFNNGWMLAGIAISVAAMPALVVLTCLWIAMIKAVVLRRAKPGIYPLYSFYYLVGIGWPTGSCVRAAACCCRSSPTIFLLLWMRLLGAKIGKHAGDVDRLELHA